MVAELQISDGVTVRKGGESPERFTFAMQKDNQHVSIDVLHDDVDAIMRALTELWAEWQTD